jgi:NTP pyrophosphatase (non-canonical NTP hydrolase)
MTLQNLAKQAGEDGHRWFPEVQHLPHQVLSLAGEVGELANLVKKVDRGTDTFDDLRHQMISELMDVFVYAFAAAALLGIKDLDQMYANTRNLNELRFNKSSII